MMSKNSRIYPKKAVTAITSLTGTKATVSPINSSAPRIKEFEKRETIRSKSPTIEINVPHQ